VPFPGTTADGVEERKEAELKTDGEKKPKDLVFELHGDQFQHRAADRANKKFKPHFFPDL
jgi:ribonuclease P protein subunit POP4